MFVHFEFVVLTSLGKKTKKKPACLPALKIFPMLRETNNQFYMASAKINGNQPLVVGDAQFVVFGYKSKSILTNLR